MPHHLVASKSNFLIKYQGNPRLEADVWLFRLLSNFSLSLDF
jgi:hypothetical protein